MRLLTADSADYRELADVTAPTKFAYALRWGHECVREEHTEANRHRLQWERVEFWRRWLPNSGWLFFTGADVAITNQEKPVCHVDDGCIAADLIICADGNGLQSDSWFMQEGPATLKFLDNVLALEDRVKNEQIAMNLILSGFSPSAPVDALQAWAELQNELMPYHSWWPGGGLLERCQEVLNRSPVRVQFTEQRLLNAYPSVCYGSDGSEHWSWRPGDFVAHVVACAMETRISWFKANIRS
jgi:hypothetical protein